MEVKRSRKNLTQFQRHIIAYLFNRGQTVQQIAQDDQLKPITVKTVKYWVDRLKETGDVKTAPRSGRPRKLTRKQEEKLIRFIKNNPRMKYRIVKGKLKFLRLMKITRRTINHYARRRGIRAYRSVQKPPLSESNKTERLAFAQKILSDPVLQGELIFSDEKLFAAGPTNRVTFVRRLKSRKGQHLAYNERYIQRRKRPTANSNCNVWLYIWSGGKGDIFLAENTDYFDETGRKRPDAPQGKPGGFNNRSYTRMLERLAIPSFNRRMLTYTFIQDNSPVHTGTPDPANTTAIVLRRNNVESLKFPPNSPDMHPVEHAHNLLQTAFYEELDRRVRKPKNKQQTFELLKWCWKNLVDNDTVIKLYNSIKSKCLRVVECQGSNNFKG